MSGSTIPFEQTLSNLEATQQVPGTVADLRSNQEEISTRLRSGLECGKDDKPSISFREGKDEAGNARIIVTINLHGMVVDDENLTRAAKAAIRDVAGLGCFKWLVFKPA